jgi:hypothetical protein
MLAGVIQAVFAVCPPEVHTYPLPLGLAGGLVEVESTHA